MKVTKVTIEKSKFGSQLSGTYFIRVHEGEKSREIAIFYTREYAKLFANAIASNEGVPVEWMK